MIVHLGGQFVSNVAFGFSFGLGFCFIRWLLGKVLK
jgi:hypothetical protein